MKSLRMFAAVLMAVCLTATAVQAGDIGLYFDANATTNTATKPLSTSFNAYVCLTNMSDLVNAVEYKVNLPAELLLLNQTFAGNFVNGSSNASGVQIGLGECMIMFDPNAVFVLSTMTAMALSPINNATITIAGWPLPNGAPLPRYSSCGANPALIDLNPQTSHLTAAVGTAEETWGAVKALYNE